MPFMPAEPIVHPTYQSMQFDGSVAQATEIAWAIDSGVANKLLARSALEVFQNGESGTQWRITLIRPDGTDMTANPTDWIVVASTGVIRVLSDAAYRAEFTVTGV